MKVVYKKNFFLLIMVYVAIFGCAAGLMTKSEKYSTPEKTWEIYKEAIMRGDLEAALDVFRDEVKDRERKWHYDRVIGIKGARKRIEPIKNIELVRSGINDQHGLHLPTEYKEYRIVTEKGPDDRWTIFFVKINGEWKIEALPF